MNSHSTALHSSGVHETFSTARPKTFWQTVQGFFFQSPWTISLTTVMVLLNLGLLVPNSLTGPVLEIMQYDRAAVLHGQVWRIVAGNLVHWSTEHFLLDVAAFAVLGWMFERSLGKSFPWLMLISATAVGTSALLLPDMATYRGLSGVDSGLFAAALWCECRTARNQPKNWLYLVPVMIVFVIKLIYECTTGELFFGTQALGDLGQPVPLAHFSGTVSVVLALGVAAMVRTITGWASSP